jgi:hypothetical protein
MRKNLKKKHPRSSLTGIGVRCLICITAGGFALFSHIDKQNELTELRLAIPVLAKEVKALTEENISLKYDVDRFESPIHLMELMRKPEFGHLKFPYTKDEIFLERSSPPDSRLSETQSKYVHN